MVWSVLYSLLGSGIAGCRVGIITPYQSQRVRLERMVREQVRLQSNPGYQDVTVSTIDGMQGKEKDIIILDMVVRTPQMKHVGFVSDLRRLNVALSRARDGLILIGPGRTYVKNSKGKLIQRLAKFYQIMADIAGADAEYVMYMHVARDECKILTSQEAEDLLNRDQAASVPILEVEQQSLPPSLQGPEISNWDPWDDKAWQELGANVQKRLLHQASPAERLKLLKQFDRDKLEPTKDEQLAILAKESQMRLDHLNPTSKEPVPRDATPRPDAPSYPPEVDKPATQVTTKRSWDEYTNEHLPEFLRKKLG